jgi:hypothetical protein
VSRYSVRKITKLLSDIGSANTNDQKGLLLEELVIYIFEKVPGIEMIGNRELNVFEDEEVDALFWNGSDNRLLGFLGCPFAVECKSWSRSVGSRAITSFKSTLKSRGCSYGILVALNGISGTINPPTQAHHEIVFALSEMCHILIVTREEIATLRETDDLAFLLKQKACDLARKGTAL